MQTLGKDESLPEEMQGKWVIVDEPQCELVISGGHIECFGKVVAYDYKEISREYGAITVTLRINNPENEDTFQRTNITSLAITPDGDFVVWNVKFGARMVRSMSRR